jgi:steroid 5-alpha reductase family enzyme
MNHVAAIIAENFGIMMGFAILLWLICIGLKDVSLIDRFWGPACALPGLLTLLQTHTLSTRTSILLTLSWIWAARLAYHITRRNWGSGEDYRYDIMMAKVSFPRSKHLKTLVHVFLLQAMLAVIISSPLQLGQIGLAHPLGVFSYIGICLWIVGILFEVIGDHQLRRFKADPRNKGQVMTLGLWSWTRHPNYFGDSTVWFGLFLIAVESDWGIYGIVGPLVLLYFLLKVTGVDLLEKSMRQRYDAYENYMQRTSSFIPMPPRKQISPESRA